MQCNKCGKEFGEGVICQHCGVDRVTGLAGYHGYETPSGNGSTLPSSSESVNGPTIPSAPPYVSNVVEEKTMICYACNEIIPADSVFCPVCGQKLYVVCPSCGSKYSSKYEICNKCGTNRVQFEQQRLERERIAKEERTRKEKERKIREEKKREEERRIAEEKLRIYREEKEEKQKIREEQNRKEKLKRGKEQVKIWQKEEKERREKEQKEIEHRAYETKEKIRKESSAWNSPLFYLWIVFLIPIFLYFFYFDIVKESISRWITIIISVILYSITEGINDYLKGQDYKENIHKYIRDHPNDLVNQYLKKEIE
jgi:predicted RNA-binding Zn-ribbon protein involved in translation (DUF1610 family)